MLTPSPVAVSPAAREDFERIADLTVRVYLDGGLVSEGYAPELADVAGRAGRSELLVVRDDGGRVVGSVALVLSGDFGEVTTSDEEAAFRMLVVDPEVQGQGMTGAKRVYGRLGFTRLPERDWSPVPGIDLLVYVREL